MPDQHHILAQSLLQLPQLLTSLLISTQVGVYMGGGPAQAVCPAAQLLPVPRTQAMGLQG